MRSQTTDNPYELVIHNSHVESEVSGLHGAGEDGATREGEQQRAILFRPIFFEEVCPFICMQSLP